MGDIAAAFDAIRARGRLAMRHPFELDDFQKEAVVWMEGSCAQGVTSSQTSQAFAASVFVAAHTSAGKTAIAEYAVAMALRDGGRAIMTAPLKTISNQKYRDFCDRFGPDQVGLVTGDTVVNPDAPVLVMTTEVLRSMLYRGAAAVDEAQWVIFDEVHYVNDPERGVVWEEAIILLPRGVRTVMLSATVPNAHEFAEWVAGQRGSPMHVITTSVRPVPLTHALIVTKGPGVEGRVVPLTGAQSVRGAWAEATAPSCPPPPPPAASRSLTTPPCDTSRKAGDVAANHRDKARRAKADAVLRECQQPSRTRAHQQQSHTLQLVRALQARDLLPAALFVFSKRRCDVLADELGSLDLSEGRGERFAAHSLVTRSIDERLTEAERRIPQVAWLRCLLVRGIAVHHAGLLPLLKEVVEILACRGAVRLLLCTETFAMGVNAPMRTVVFDSLWKHDGTCRRLLLPGEYTQMAGRAGRRGVEARGQVLVSLDGDAMQARDVEQVVYGDAAPIRSRFRLTFCTVLNWLRMEGRDVTELMRASFLEARAALARPALQAELEALSNGRDDDPDDAPHTTLAAAYADVMSHLAAPPSASVAGKLLCPGRPLSVSGSPRASLAYIVRRDREKDRVWVCDTLPAAAGDRAEGGVLVHVRDITAIHPMGGAPDTPPIPPSAFKLRQLDAALSVAEWSRRSRRSMRAGLSEGVAPATDPQGQLTRSGRVRELRRELSAESAYHAVGYAASLRLLQSLGYVDGEGVVLLKGRATCKLGSVVAGGPQAAATGAVTELLPVEFAVDGGWRGLLPAELAALLSTIVLTVTGTTDAEPGRARRTPRLELDNHRLTTAFGRLTACAARLADAAGSRPSPTALDCCVFDCVLAWAQGASFVDACAHTDLMEGEVVRTLARLAQACREMACAAEVLGDATLVAGMTSAAQLVGRDLVTAPSMYVPLVRR